MFSLYDVHTVSLPHCLADIGKDFTKQVVLCPRTVNRVKLQSQLLACQGDWKEHPVFAFLPMLPNLLHPLLFLPSCLSKTKTMEIKNQELLALK